VINQQDTGKKKMLKLHGIGRTESTNTNLRFADRVEVSRHTLLTLVSIISTSSQQATQNNEHAQCHICLQEAETATVGSGAPNYVVQQLNLAPWLRSVPNASVTYSLISTQDNSSNLNFKEQWNIY